MKKIFSYLLLTLFAISSQAAVLEPNLNDYGITGEGTEASPYLIKTCKDLRVLANACNILATATSTANPLTRGHYVGKYFRLENDLDCDTMQNFLGIATALPTATSATAGATTTSYFFGGVFDGNGKTIKNLKIDGIVLSAAGALTTTTGANSNRQYVGFFGLVSQGGLVKNLTIDSSCEFQGYNGVGGIAGYVGNNGKVSNCVNKATIRAFNSYAGGVVGHLVGTSSIDAIVENCVNYGTVITHGTYAGGITSMCSYGTVNNCVNFGTVSGETHKLKENGAFSQIGGVVSMFSYGKANGFVNYGTVHIGKSTAATTGNQSGGLFGDCQASTTAGGLENGLQLGVLINEGNSTTIGYISGRNGASAATVMPMKNIYYDSQLNACMPAFGQEYISSNTNTCEVTGMATAALTNGTPLTGFPTSVMTYTNGYYPIVTEVAEAAKPAAGTYATLPTGVNADNFTGTATFPSGVTAAVTPAGSIFTVSGNQIVAGTAKELRTDTLTLTNGDFVRKVLIRQMPKLWDGEGTQANPYQIKTKADLMNLAEMVNGDVLMHYDNTYFKMMNNIDMQKDSTFRGIGTRMGLSSVFNVVYFNGKFDGGGYTISNMVINNVAFNASGAAQTVANGSAQATGLFGVLSTGAEITNVNLDATCRVTGYGYTGGIAGYLLNNAKIDNCTNAGLVFTYSSGGAGIGAYTSGADVSITNCLNTGDISTLGTTNCSYIAGISGYGKGTISNCVNTGKIYTNYRYPGGIVGYAYGVNVTDCANYGVVYGNNFTGGFTSYVGANGTTLDRILTTGQVFTTNASPNQIASCVAQDAGTATVITTIKNAYVDQQVQVWAPIFTASVNYKEGNIVESTTSELTAGTKIAGLGDNWTFTKGYYPIPTKWANNAAVKAAACTFMTQTSGDINKFSGATINNIEPLTAKLSDGSVFKINGLNVTVGNADAIVKDTLTLTNGNFVAIYPLQKLPSVLPGSGTQTDPYQIKSAADLTKIANYMNDANYPFAGEYFQVMNDIDFTGETLTPIGSSATPFQGIVDGKNFTIKNLKIDYDETNFNNTQALFNNLGASAVVENMKLSNFVIHNYQYAAGIATTTAGTIRNIYIDETCEFACRYKSTLSGQAGTYAAGIANSATNGAVFENCVNKANLTAMQYLGGIVSYVVTANVISISNCENYGNVVSTADYRSVSTGGAPTKQPAESFAAGIAGSVQGTIHNAANYGNVTAEKGTYCGGIAGRAWANTTIDSVMNYGNIQIADTTYGYYGGGIVGGLNGTSATANVVISYASNHGTVYGYQYIGGILGYGYNVGGKVTYAENFGDITASNGINPNNTSANGQKVRNGCANAGGIVGYVAGTTTGGFIVDNCYNVGTVTGENGVAGIVGRAQAITNITNSFNAGRIFGLETTAVLYSASGITNGTANVTNCYNAGDIDGYRCVGGIIGQPGGACSVTNAYNSGNLTASFTGEDTQGYIGSIYGTIRNYDLKTDNVFAIKNDSIPADVDVNFGIDMKSRADLCLVGKTLGSAFVSNDYALPMLAVLDTVRAAKAYAAYFECPELNAADAVDVAFELSELPGVEWLHNKYLTVENGVATPVEEGMAELTAVCGKWLKTYNFLVEPVTILPESITLDKTEVTLLEGETATLTATVKPDNTTDPTVTWNSDNTAVATVADGVVTAVAKGEATITAACGEVSATCKVTVTEKDGVLGITVDADALLDIYTVDGMVVGKGMTILDIKNLAKGTYIVVSDGKAWKIKI